MAIEDLSQSHCSPLKGPEHRLPRESIEAALAELPGWTLDASGTRIRRTFGFADYYRTIAFVNALAFIAHREDHHPDLSVHYDRCVVEYATHDCGGVTRNDLICAAKASALYAEGHGG
ncbi:MAG: putative pterin-4-alpha-carbinolamine dehydratase [Lysobacteraceae bacterium]|nr:MAG: putative pterin-4-alpha-carbinolamine dehydratase [Xanthomonadaceae bacterium]